MKRHSSLPMRKESFSTAAVQKVGIRPHFKRDQIFRFASIFDFELSHEHDNNIGSTMR